MDVNTSINMYRCYTLTGKPHLVVPCGSIPSIYGLFYNDSRNHDAVESMEIGVESAT